MATVQRQMTSGAEPRWKYARPTEKAQHGKPWTHEGGAQLPRDREEYVLPVIDVQTERRNYPGVTEETFWTAEELADAVGDTWGTTETDSTYTGKQLGGR